VVIEDSVNREHLVRFLSRYGVTRNKLEVLFSFSRNLEACFSPAALAGKPGGRRVLIIEDVKSPVGDGIVREKKVDSHAVRYCLTVNKPKRRCIEQLINMDAAHFKSSGITVHHSSVKSN